MTDKLRDLIAQMLVPVLSAAAGGWFGVTTAVARLDERLIAMDRQATQTAQRLQRLEDVNSNHSVGPLAEHREFRERITRLEAQMEDMRR